MTRTKQSARKSTGGRAPKKKVLKAPVASTAPANQARDDTSSSDGAINGDAPQSSRGYSETTIGDAAKTFTAAEWAGVLESVGLLYNQAMEIPGFIYGTWDDSKRQFVQMEPSDNVMNKLDPGEARSAAPPQAAAVSEILTTAAATSAPASVPAVAPLAGTTPVTITAPAPGLTPDLLEPAKPTERNPFKGLPHKKIKSLKNAWDRSLSNGHPLSAKTVKQILPQLPTPEVSQFMADISEAFHHDKRNKRKQKKLKKRKHNARAQDEGVKQQPPVKMELDY